jgi:glycosyltransferase involved in cell wall biosynthesis
MKIAFIAPFGLQPKGTVSARMLPLAHALARRGHMVRVIVPPWDDPSAREDGGGKDNVASLIEVDGRYAGVHVVTLPLPRKAPPSAALTYGLVKSALWPSRAGRHPFENRAYREALNALTTFRAEVAHVFKPVGYSGLAGFALAGLRVPWVLDVDDWEGPGGWADVNRYSAAQKLAVTVQEALLPRVAGAVTAASRTLEARAWSFGLPGRRVLYMPNGVWRERYGSWADQFKVQASRGYPKFKVQQTTGATLLLYTRFAEFPLRWPLDVLQRVRERHPDVRLLVVGSGFFGEEERLKVEAEERGLGDHVVVAGYVPEEELPAWLGRGDVALYPMADTLINRAKSPVKVLEPMVMGLPLVAHRVGQAAEFIGDAGVLVEPGDIQGMAEAVSALLDDPDRRESLGRRAQERVWREFNWERLSLVAESAFKVALKVP